MAQALLARSFKQYSANNFRLNLIREDPAPDIIYQFFGRASAWDDENVPPDPQDFVQEFIDTREDIIAMKKITITDVSHVARRVDWSSGTVYVEYAPDDALLYSKDFYVLTDELNVYKCIDNNGSVPSTAKPTSTGTSIITTGDGYRWKYMLTIPQSLTTPFLTKDWMPIPIEENRTASQIAVENTAVYEEGGPLGGHGSNPLGELYASNIMMTVRWDETEGGILPSGLQYRQIGLWVNPLLPDGDPATSNVLFFDSDTDIDRNSGRIIYIENRTVIERVSDQVEQISIILKF
jgi:hypothetical protein